METALILFIFVIGTRARSYPTYEEWKPRYVSKIFKLIILFLSYLWGMETGKTCSWTFWRCVVLILPMRNGNRALNCGIYNSISCSYPTYEEWKQGLEWRAIDKNKSSYPTYEEWKQAIWFCIFWADSFVLILPMRNGNLCKRRNRKRRKRVLILPMRNGNNKIPIKDFLVISVLILPMRNGNIKQIQIQNQILLMVLILPMRNGNHHNISLIWLPRHLRSYPTYEEWKHLLLSVESFIIW